jgi:hypothetical protein
MRGIAIYMEGGGDSRDAKVALRQGMDDFLRPLKDSARVKSLHWKLVCCGGRDQAYSAFLNAHRIGEFEIVVLLVDAELEVIFAPCVHLKNRDNWDFTGIDDGAVHLMTQTMETWIVADPNTLAAYYGQRFNRNALPRAQNLETVGKQQIASSLEQATRLTQKGAYHKIRHASDLLKLIGQRDVRIRCPSCERFFAELAGDIAAM